MINRHLTVDNLNQSRSVYHSKTVRPSCRSLSFMNLWIYDIVNCVYNIPFFSINDIKDTTRLKPWPLWLQLQGTLSSEFDPPHPAPHCMCPHSWPSQMSSAWPQVFQITRGENTGAGWRVTCDMRQAPELQRTIPSPIRTIAHDSARRTHYNCTFHFVRTIPLSIGPRSPGWRLSK